MKVILKKHVARLGDEWDIVTVKDGYARNFLFPKNMAETATATLIKKAEIVKANRVKKVDEISKNAKESAKKLSGIVISFKKKAKKDKLYGSITEKEIIEALAKEHKVEVSKDMIIIKEPIKTIGEHKIKIALAEKSEAKITIKVEEDK